MSVFQRLWHWIDPAHTARGLGGRAYLLISLILFAAFAADQVSGVQMGALVSGPSHATPQRIIAPVRPADAYIPAHPAIHVITPAQVVFVQHTPYCIALPARCHVRTAVPGPLGGTQWYVGSFHTYDTGVEIAGIINAAGDYYDIWPVYILGVIFAESGGNQYSDRYGVWPDVSFGLTQVTVATLGGYGVCGGFTACARAWLDNPVHAIWMGARILRDYESRTDTGYPGLWQCYNAGPASCQSPFYYSDFLPNYYRALPYGWPTNNYAPRPPKPRKPRAPFNERAWCAYAKAHHKSCPPHLYHHRLSRFAWVWQYDKVRGKHVYHVCGAPTGWEVWWRKPRFMRQGYRYCLGYHWPHDRGDPVKFSKR